ncbi:MAG TPA: M48 family metallopeptidase [Gemmatimonadaceae bacterium]
MTASVRPHPDRSRGAPIVVERWHTETPLFLISAIISILVWIVAAVSVVGLVYAFFFAVFFFFVHLGFISHVRGSGVRLGPEQFPELHARVVQLARRMNMKTVPETYVVQAGGALNALATRFARSHMVVLFSDLLDACGEDEAARDMIIAHELGHIHAGHLDWRMLTLPASLIPFLGHALSRAREYTCDRYGLAGAGSADGATRGLAILAAGAVHGPKLNRAALVRQRADINTGWMTLGSWLSTHPPLAKRMAQLDPSLAGGAKLPPTGALRAVGILASLWLLPVIGAVAVMASPVGTAYRQAMESARQGAAQATLDASAVPGEPGAEPVYAMEDPAETARRNAANTATAQRDLMKLAILIEQGRARGEPIPWNWEELRDRWVARNPNVPYPEDPFDSATYGYERIGEDYRLWSTGPDVQSYTEDDLVWDSRVQRGRR